jgi:hypothetical protein
MLFTTAFSREFFLEVLLARFEPAMPYIFAFEADFGLTFGTNDKALVDVVCLYNSITVLSGAPAHQWIQLLFLFGQESLQLLEYFWLLCKDIIQLLLPDLSTAVLSKTDEFVDSCILNVLRKASSDAFVAVSVSTVKFEYIWTVLFRYRIGVAHLTVFLFRVGTLE